ncbi:hypothetical protein [Stutzerimonas stutzeri]|uniref:hypothetical protein n=1 Tax=Stutzerimonas stutzeri TaxID=316 RepID=UPI00210A0974|nr:hypothetical protein [Stutzerimonas stutzeri]MCQ4319245.1 hypothetical protein [Stutzerimonas stutzeri]
MLFVRRHMGLFVSWLVALAVASATTLSLPHAFKQMIDQGFSSASGADIDKAFLAYSAWWWCWRWPVRPAH